MDPPSVAEQLKAHFEAHRQIQKAIADASGETRLARFYHCHKAILALASLAIGLAGIALSCLALT